MSGARNKVQNPSVHSIRNESPVNLDFMHEHLQACREHIHVESLELIVWGSGRVVLGLPVGFRLFCLESRVTHG